jgi:hypothetical protein
MNYVDYCIWLGAVSAIILFACYSWKVMQQSDSIYKGLDAIWDRAKKTNDRNMLRFYMRELELFHKKNCWHRHHGNYARQVKAYIEGKLA